MDIGAQIGIDNLDNENINDVFVENDNVNEMPVENDNCDDVDIENDDDARNFDDIAFENVHLSKIYHFPNIYDATTQDGLDSKMIVFVV